MFRPTRRRFLRSAAAGGLVILANPWLAHTYAANEKLNVALIGVGGRGKWYVDVMFQQANVVAFCDLNNHRLKPVGSSSN